jgi:hypothetical protein
MTVRQGLLPFKIEIVQKARPVTARAGLAIVLEALRALYGKPVWRRLARALDYSSWRTVRRHAESLVLLMVDGGRNLDDLAVLRADEGLRHLVGFTPSSSTQAKDFLYRFDQAEDGRRLTPKESAALAVRGEARIRPEGPALRLLADVLGEIPRRQQAKRQRLRATLDVDASVVAANKASALKAYEGTVGYQPQMAWWAEQRLWVADEFRDGNVNAEFRIKQFIQRAFAALPGSVTERRLRGDTALYNEEALTWADDEGIRFAVSADMSDSLTKAATAVPDDRWRPYRTLREGPEQDREDREERQWADVPDFVPDWKRNRRKNGTALRYIAIRVRRRQLDLLSERPEPWRCFAIVTNMDWDGERLLRWQREKQGTVEHGHGVLQNGLAAGVLPCGRFGANAAWWRLNAVAHNLLVLLQTLALPASLMDARPKTLRFRLFHLAGWITRSARRLVVHLSAAHPFAEALVTARDRLLELARAPATGPQAA